MEQKRANYERRAPRQLVSLSVTYKCATSLVEDFLEDEDFIGRGGELLRMGRAARQFLEILPCVAAPARGRLLFDEFDLPLEVMVKIFGYLGAQDRRNCAVYSHLAAQAESLCAPNMRVTPREFDCVVVWH